MKYLCIWAKEHGFHYLQGNMYYRVSREKEDLIQFYTFWRFNIEQSSDKIKLDLNKFELGELLNMDFIGWRKKGKKLTNCSALDFHFTILMNSLSFGVRCDFAIAKN